MFLNNKLFSFIVITALFGYSFNVIAENKWIKAEGESASAAKIYFVNQNGQYTNAQGKLTADNKPDFISATIITQFDSSLNIKVQIKSDTSKYFYATISSNLLSEYSILLVTTEKTLSKNEQRFLLQVQAGELVPNFRRAISAKIENIKVTENQEDRATGSTTGATGSTTGATGSTTGATGSTTGATGSTTGATGSTTGTIITPPDWSRTTGSAIKNG